MPHLFEPLVLRSVTFRNRIGISPMCQYSSQDGLPGDWHMAHLGSRAAGGAGLVFVEATAVTADGRISPDDMGIWSDAHTGPLARLARFIGSQGAVPGIQIAHAGRKASKSRPWDGDRSLGLEERGWRISGPSPLAFEEGWQVPHELTVGEIEQVREAFAAAALRARDAGFRVLELHGAHGYLIHSFLSPLSNRRTDRYGGSFENRTRFLLETVQAVRQLWPSELPLFVRLSATDWTAGGWTLDDSIALAKILKDEGVDLIDCSSGGVTKALIPVGAGYQVPLAEGVKRGAGISTAAVGMITDAAQADQIVRNEQADMVLIARQSLRDPHWPIHAAQQLKWKGELLVPPQYQRM